MDFILYIFHNVSLFVSDMLVLFVHMVNNNIQEKSMHWKSPKTHTFFKEKQFC